jgi:FAD/FMN-containing dehydrogenase
MKTLTSLNFSMFRFLLFVLLLSFALQTTMAQDFFQCFSLKTGNTTSKSHEEVVYTQSDSAFSSVLHFSLYNRRFATDSVKKPLYIVTPTNPSHIQATILCSKLHNLQIRIRSGGHDFEGLSYVSNVPFVVLDLINLRSIAIDVETKTAWVEGGATIGELFYEIGISSETLAFPAGICPTVGVGGHFSGGGIGMLWRKYGLASDQIIDAKVIDVNGNILDRESMGEDLFWAIRGGGGNSFGVVLSWKLNLVTVPAKVTFFEIPKTVEQNATKVLYRFQEMAREFPDELLIAANASHSRDGTFRVLFEGLYIGNIEGLLPIMDEKFPELGLRKEDCLEMKWVESVLLSARAPPGTKLEALLDRTQHNSISYKSKSDYTREVIPESVLDGVWEWFAKDEAKIGFFLLTPSGGKMNEIAESATPYPHRAGNLFQIQYVVSWNVQGTEASEKHLNWMTGLFNYMTPYVSKNPRASYVNFRDLDLGSNNVNGKYTSYQQAKVWGTKYFKGNFDRLVHVKTKVDPTNFFRHEQSIPPLTAWK